MNVVYRCLLGLIATTSVSAAGDARAADVIFQNGLGARLYLHMRVGSVGQPADQRGSANTTIAAGASHTENVGDGDVYYAYGNRQIGGDENPELCLAAGGQTVVLNNRLPCYVNN